MRLPLPGSDRSKRARAFEFDALEGRAGPAARRGRDAPAVSAGVGVDGGDNSVEEKLL